MRPRCFRAAVGRSNPQVAAHPSGILTAYSTVHPRPRNWQPPPPSRPPPFQLPQKTPAAFKVWQVYVAVLISICGATIYISKDDDAKIRRGREATLDPQSWLSLSIRRIDRIGDGDTSILSLSQSPAAPSRSADARLHIDSVYIKQPDLMIQRPYTPLEPLDRSSRGIIRLLVKRYADGEVSSYLHGLSLGCAVEVRGPEMTWKEREPGSTKEIVFIAGGTGITPFIQLAQRLYGPFGFGPQDTATLPPKLNLVFAARTASSLYLRSQIDELVKRHPDRVAVHYVVDGTPPPGRPWWKIWSTASGEDKDETRGRINAGLLRRWIGQSSHEDGKIVLVAGPESMVAWIAGPRGADGRSQGPVGGILKSLGYRDEEVWKL